MKCCFISVKENFQFSNSIFCVLDLLSCGSFNQDQFDVLIGQLCCRESVSVTTFRSCFMIRTFKPVHIVIAALGEFQNLLSHNTVSVEWIIRCFCECGLKVSSIQSQCRLLPKGILTTDNKEQGGFAIILAKGELS